MAVTYWMVRDNERINLSDYGFAWYRDGRLVRTGLVDGLEDTMEALIEEGWEEVEDDTPDTWGKGCL